MKLGVALIYAEDFEAMVSFYRDALGLEMIRIDPGDEYEEGVDFAYLDAGGAGVEIFDRAVHPPELPSAPGGAVRTGFQVDDLDAARSGLAAHGIQAGAVVSRDWGRYSELADPEGNPLVVFDLAG